MPDAITATGARGYFQWLEQDQPALYARVMPIVMAQIPQIFSDYAQGQTMGRLMAGLGQDDDDVDDDLDETDFADTDDDDDDLDETDFADTDDDETDLTSSDSGYVDEDLAQYALPAGSTAAASTATTTAAASSVANTSMTPAQASSIQSIIGSVLGPTAGTEAGQLYANLTGQQLTNAVAGLPPTSATSSASGIGQLVADATSGPGLIIGIGALAIIGIIIATSSSAPPPQARGR